MQAGVRDLAARAGVGVEELEERNRCCGHGGHIRTANPALYDEITTHRVEASDKPYIVYCANCREVFASKGKECAHILDVAFGLGSDDRVPDPAAEAGQQPSGEEGTDEDRRATWSSSRSGTNGTH